MSARSTAAAGLAVGASRTAQPISGRKPKVPESWLIPISPPTKSISKFLPRYLQRKGAFAGRLGKSSLPGPFPDGAAESHGFRINDGAWHFCPEYRAYFALGLS